MSKSKKNKKSKQQTPPPPVTKLAEDLPQTEETEVKKERVITEDLPQESEDQPPKVITEEAQ